MGRKNKHTKEFKQDAVNLITQEGYAIREAGRNLGIHEATLRRWKKELEQGDKVSKKKNSDKEEILRLKKKIKELEMEKEILKKAAVFFAKESD